VLITATGYGCHVGLRVPEARLEEVRSWLPHWWTDADVEPQQVWTLTSAGSAEVIVGDLELWVAEHAVDLIFVHAGVVAFDGRALLLPGRSMAGKTTLTAALLRAGASYGSDEYAVLTNDGLVLPYARPLWVRHRSGRTRTPAAEFGAATFAGPLPVGAVAALQYRAAVEHDVRSITPGTAVLRLFDNTVCAQTRPQQALDALLAATQSIQAVEGHRGDADDAAVQLRKLISS
jgi:hypothetical protein